MVLARLAFPAPLSRPILVLGFALCAADPAPALAQEGSGKAAPSPAQVAAQKAADENAAADLLKRGKAAYQAGQWRGAEEALAKAMRLYPHARAAEEAVAMLTDIALRQGKDAQAQAWITRFRKNYLSSTVTPRMMYYQGLVHMRAGRNFEAARALANACNYAADAGLYDQASKALLAVAATGLTGEDAQTAIDILDRNSPLKVALQEAAGDAYARQGKNLAARGAYGEWLERYGDQPRAAEVRRKYEQAASAPRKGKVLLAEAPLSGDYADVGKALAEGAQLAVEEWNQKGGPQLELRFVDTQGNPIAAVQRLRKALREEGVDAVVGPAMSDEAMAVAVDLSARRARIPMVTPTATTQGIASLGDGVFQLNVTTATLGQKVAAYAVHCLRLKDYAILAPQNEYGRQLAEAFQRTVERFGGNVIAVQWYDGEANDFTPQFDAIRRAKARLDYDRERMEKGLPADNRADNAALAKAAADSVLVVDGIFIAASNGEEAYKLASQALYHKLRGQILGSSGWNDKSMLHKGGTAVVGSVFSVDFPDNPRAEAWQGFAKRYQARWGKAPDKVSALAYDAGRFLAEGLGGAPNADGAIPALKAVKVFNGVQGRIVFDEKSGANQNTALYRVQKSGFKEVDPCPESE